MKEDKIKSFLKNTEGAVLNTEELTLEDIEELTQRRRELVADSVSKRQKEAEDKLVSELQTHLQNKDIPEATRCAIEFLITVYGHELLGIWALRYYKRMTSGDITPFDRASTQLLKMRGDI